MQRHLSIFILCQLLLCALLTGLPLSIQTALAAETYTFSAIDTDAFDDSLLIRLRGDRPPAFTHYQLVNPTRVIIDIAEGELLPTIDSKQITADSELVDLTISTIRSTSNQDLRTTRLELQVADTHASNIDREDNDLLILLYPKAGAAVNKSTALALNDKATPIEQAPLLNAPIIEQTPADKLKKTFQFSGYETERISIDFYKIDLHNVFRLFREISGQNIVVDEAVKGSLTLTLDDVPWDFALDIILNLTNLKKEERFNTLVIYPASSDFLWPERAADNFSFEADQELAQTEALIIEESERQPASVMQAKDMIRKARILEKDADLEAAAALYEQALNLWPDNAELANRLATIYLVDLRINARAIYFSNKGLQANPENLQAALYGAIGLANMGRTAEALDYFNQSVSGDKPLKEALISFAAFNEENGQFNASLALLKRHDQTYGESLTSMAAAARIHDKMGQDARATRQYRALLASGFQLPPDLENYIQARLSLSAPLQTEP